MSKAGLVAISFKKIVNLPDRKDKNQNEKANKFTRGLQNYLSNTLKRSFGAFKNEF